MLGVVKCDDDTGNPAAGVNVIRIIQPMRRREGEDAFENGVAPNLLVEFLGWGEVAFRVPDQGHAAQEHRVVSRSRGPPAIRAKGSEKDGLVFSNVVAFLESRESENEVLINDRRRPVASE
jgi:hypothetical protein